ncbi:hypothetical protein VE01_09248 [Pseudogymnoascus verrucosus]|uniref:Fungal-type protein kinase domain-containing protein n=1 Tax=Pseudogymnoascus verrucosus TaxID=342668 RepID=A0A1B8GBC2_9PEZI|nr:uncharacterized protein VE01_09248 [Pseudogymnoascus verrucosus]OBT93131.1 hypothetical protein VE01_09248 [Pseudogymnoascus verrucosus]
MASGPLSLNVILRQKLKEPSNQSTTLASRPGREQATNAAVSSVASRTRSFHSDDFDIERVTPLLKAVINNESDDIIWDKAYAAVTESTPPRPLPFLNQTPWSNATSSIVNSSEHRKYANEALKEELGSSLYIGVPGFVDAFFGGMAELDSISKAVFAKCQQGGNPLFTEGRGWRDWPNEAKEPDVLTWFDSRAEAGEVFVTQDTRRFVLGFTLCGSVMRLWEFDRLGGIASSPFDVNQDGLQFVSAVLGYLLMERTQLGFDPTILEADGERYIEIMRDGRKERLVLDKVMKRVDCVAGRATTCWKAHRADDDAKAPLVIKDSWQYPEREEERDLLQEATEKGVVNVARHYCHETVHVAGQRDDDQNNVRKALDISKATNYFVQRKKADSSMLPPKPFSKDDAIRRGRSSADTIHRKRSSSSLNAPLPPAKRTYSSSPTKREHIIDTHNRIRRRVIVCDYGTPIYKARSVVAMLAALASCIEGHESLYTKAGML